VLESVGSPPMWGAFFVFVAAMLALDLGVFNRGAHTISARQALRWTGVWVSLALAFGGVMLAVFGPKVGLEFYTGWVIEYSLSVDNIFVFILIFRVFRIPDDLQHRVLFWGILGALALRLIMIMLGAALVAQFHAILYVFGAFLLYSGIKILASKKDDDDEEERPDKNPLVRAVMRLVPSTQDLHGQQFFIHDGKRRLATPLFITLITVEVSDVIFAVDSIPAIFAITTDPFVVFTSNIFAIMGLRSLYFLLAQWVGMFRFLETGLGLVLSFVGAKMLVSYLHWDLHPAVSLGVIVGVLGGSMLLSVLIKEKPEAPPTPPSA
jgi:tellurite resistance protein TerC